LVTGNPILLSSQTEERRVSQAENLISLVLRIGVLASLLCVVAGTVISFIHHPEYLSSTADLHRLTQPGAAFPHTLHDVIAGVRGLRGQAIVTFGLLLLIATPVVRVAVSIFIFLYRKDRIFTLITSAVLALLLASFALGLIGR
jgi:uncharacterized membrane protein